MEIDPHTATLLDAKSYMIENMVKGVNCPCCNQKVKRTKCKLTSRQAGILVLLHKTFPVGTVVVISHFLEAIGGEFGKELLKGKEWEKLKYWGLIEEVPATKELKKNYQAAYPDSKGRRLAFYRLTERGVGFYQGYPVASVIYALDDTVVGWEEEMVTLQDLGVGAYDTGVICAIEVAAVGHINE